MLQTALKLLLCAGFGVTGCAAVSPFRLYDARGAVHTQAEWSGQKAIVLFFVIHDCPVVNSYVPEMNRIEEAYGSRGVRFYAVQADASASFADTAEYALAFHYRLPLLVDPGQVLIRMAGATVTPQAAILSPEGQVLYRGRIDNRIEDFGSQRRDATVHDLRDALDAVLAGRPPRAKFTKAIGCAITLLKQK
jgi:peroxiredoxin